MIAVAGGILLALLALALAGALLVWCDAPRLSSVSGPDVLMFAAGLIALIGVVFA